MNDIIYTSDRKEILQYVPKVKGRVLDVGCSSGNFSRILKDEWGCEVHGIEVNPKAAEIAAEKIDRVFCGDAIDVLSEVPENYYDLITMNDVLEHLVSPYDFLNGLHKKISSTGIIFAIVPNIRYHKALAKILYEKEFEYEDEGIFDRTHLRFFTKKSIKRMFDECNYEEIDYFGINSTSSLRPWLLNLLTFGGFGNDTRYLQYAFIGKSNQMETSIDK
jgi:2-polyprenyl-3-methyl-5-hydroxy-6-metoxy-1,4-benzoquinol methylase